MPAAFHPYYSQHALFLAQHAIMPMLQVEIMEYKAPLLYRSPGGSENFAGMLQAQRLETQGTPQALCGISVLSLSAWGPERLALCMLQARSSPISGMLGDQVDHICNAASVW